MSDASPRSLWPVFGVAMVAALGIVVAPDWERRLHAQGYAEGAADAAASGLREADRDRRIVRDRLSEIEESRRAFLGGGDIRPIGHGGAGGGSSAARADSTDDAEAGASRKHFFLTLHRSTFSRRHDGDELDQQTPGFLAGFDYRLTPGLVLGVAGGLNVTLMDSENDSIGHTRGRTFTYRLGPYVAYQTEDWYVYGIGLGAVRDVRLRRRGNGERFTGRTLGEEADVSVGGGYDFYFGPLRVGPLASADYSYLRMQGFDERGDRFFRLKVETVNVHTIMARLGGQADYGIPLSTGDVIAPQIRLQGVYEDVLDGVATASQGGGDAKESAIELGQPFFLEAGLGLKYLLRDGWTFSLFYVQSFADPEAVRTRLSLTIGRQF